MRKFLSFLILALIAVTALVLFATKDRTDQKNLVDQADGQGEAQIGGPFTLTDQDGKTVHDSDFRGRLMLVFFGFTHCPDVCPVTAASMSKTMQLLGPKADQVVPLFISVDPKRDTPVALKAFLANFDKRMVGLTGTPEEIRQVEGLYKVYAGQPNASTENVDHSTMLYLMGRDGKYIRLFPYNAPAEEMARGIEHILNK